MKLRLFAVLALLILPLPALAGPREDSISTAARCSSYGDDRQWLECYYGAAQPMRAQLGLAPAAPSQVGLASRANGAPSASAGPRESVLAGSSRCTSYADNRQYLDCFYGAAQPMRARLGLSAVSASQQSLAAAAYGAGGAAVASASTFGQRAKKSSGGWFSGMFGSEDEAAVPASEFGKHQTERVVDNSGPTDGVTAHMADYKISALTGSFVIDLDNGQRWAQVQGDTTTAHWNKPAARYTVNITRGWFGSYNMRVSGEHGLYKVDRVR